MTADQIRSALRSRPFRPFAIVTASGERYNVGHPEMVWQSPGGATVIVGIKGEDVVMIDASHITEFVFNVKKTSGK